MIVPKKKLLAAWPTPITSIINEKKTSRVSNVFTPKEKKENQCQSTEHVDVR